MESETRRGGREGRERGEEEEGWRERRGEGRKEGMEREGGRREEERYRI